MVQWFNLDEELKRSRVGASQSIVQCSRNGHQARRAYGRPKANIRIAPHRTPHVDVCRDPPRLIVAQAWPRRGIDLNRLNGVAHVQSFISRHHQNIGVRTGIADHLFAYPCTVRYGRADVETSTPPSTRECACSYKARDSFEKWHFVLSWIWAWALAQDRSVPTANVPYEVESRPPYS